MCEIKFSFFKKKDAEKFNEKVCEFFQGLKAFIENDIIVGPVYTDLYNNKQSYYFYLTFADESVDQSIVIDGSKFYSL